MTETILQRNGFALDCVKDVPEMQGRLWVMEHSKSGAKLVWLDRPEENMTFAIGFRTIPTDSTGVFHILEHSVLGGSDKYPVKEPFVELLKSSLKTFLNALTFPDKTMYPVSSRNKQDFRNLIGVYMDAVLHPLAVHNPNVFRQEGWHLELDENGTPSFQGVVYNEMKGAYSDVGSLMMHTMMEKLFPDTCYRHESGGAPEHIPELTYEHFVSEHAKYYHPSNARIILDGQVDLDSTLGFLNSVLSQYDRQEMVFPIPVQKSLPFASYEIPYEIGAGESTEGKTIISRGNLLCGFDDPKTTLAAEILADYLSEGSEAPLTNAILKEGLCADFSLSVHDGMQQCWLNWKAANTDPEKRDRLLEVIKETLETEAKGLDQERLLGCYNSLAYQLMDRDRHGLPRGVLEAISILESWLYDGDPAQNLHYSAVLEELKADLNTGYFENLLRSTLLDETQGVLLTLLPDPTLGEKRVQEEQARADAYWAGLSDAQKEQTAADVEALHQWQQTPNTPEALAAIPMLKLEDLKDDPKPLEWKEEDQSGVPVLKHSTGSELVYLNLHFEASDLTPEELPLLNLLGSLLGELPTADHNAAQLQILTKQKIGMLDFSPEVYNLDVLKHRTVFSAETVCLPDFANDTAELLIEMLTRTQFTDTRLLGDTLRQQKTRYQRSLISGGNRYAAGRVVARQTSVGAVKEYMGGIEYIRWLNAHQELSEEALLALLSDMEALAKKLFTRQRMTISVSDNIPVPAFAASFPEGAEAPKSGSLPLLAPCREGILIPAAVGFAAKGGNIKNYGTKFNGHAPVLSNLMSFQYLWNAIRVQGGAYGSGFLCAESGDVICYSFRDPNPGRSLDCFDGCADFVEYFCKEHDDLTKFILGALSDTDPLLTAAKRVQLGESRYFKHVTQEAILNRSRQLRETTTASLLDFCPALRSAAAENNLCVVGGKEQLDGCGEKIDCVVDVMN